MIRCLLLASVFAALGCGAAIYEDANGNAVCTQDGIEVSCELLEIDTGQGQLTQDALPAPPSIAPTPSFGGEDAYEGCFECNSGCEYVNEGDSNTGSSLKACCYGSIRTVEMKEWTPCERRYSYSFYDCSTGLSITQHWDTITCDDSRFER